MKTMRELIIKAVEGWEHGEINQLIRVAYFMGCEETAKTICDTHNSRIAAMRTKANNMRYHNIANQVIDAWKDGVEIDDMIYTPHYAGDFGGGFGDDDFWGDIEDLKKEG